LLLVARALEMASWTKSLAAVARLEDENNKAMCKRLAHQLGLSAEGYRVKCAFRSWERVFPGWVEATDFLLEVQRLFGDGPEFPWGQSWAPR
jgi:hypothetical protein